jgi:hypothetical protein
MMRVALPITPEFMREAKIATRLTDKREGITLALIDVIRAARGQPSLIAKMHGPLAPGEGVLLVTEMQREYARAIGRRSTGIKNVVRVRRLKSK